MSAPAGRPRGQYAETSQRDRELLAMAEGGLSPEEIADQTGVSRSNVYRALARARGAPLRVQPAPDGQESEQPKPRMTERTLVHRAVSAMLRLRVFATLTAELREFWLQVVIEIRELAANGTDLTFGGAGDLYRSRSAFVGAFGRTEADLQELTRWGFLLDLEGGGIGMPVQFGLRPREKAGRSSPSGASDPRQIPMPPVGFPHRSENATHETPPEESQFRGCESHANPSGEPCESHANLTGESLARSAAAAAASIEESWNPSSSSSSQGRARETGENATPGILTEESQFRGVTELAGELVELAGLGRPPTPKDLKTVRRWQECKVPVGVIRAVITAVTARGLASPSSLAYFNGALRDVDAASAPSTTSTTTAAPEVAPPPARSAEEQALRTRLMRLYEQWSGDKRGPAPPPITTITSARAAGRGTEAERWLVALEGWRSAGSPADGRLPELRDYVANPERHEPVMAEVEAAIQEAATRDPPSAARAQSG